MLKKQIIRAIGGLNRDDDPRYLAEGDYLEMLNFRVGSNQEQEDRGLIEQFLGHYAIAFPGLTHTLTDLCVAKDEESDLAYILTHEAKATPVFQIWKMNITTDAISKIYEYSASVWGITAATRIVNPRILDGKIVWTDNVNAIRYVDLARIETSYINNFHLHTITKYSATVTYGAGDIVYFQNKYYSSLQAANTGKSPITEPTWWNELCNILDAYGDIKDPMVFELAALPPLLSASVQYISTAGRQANNLRQQTFQVSYRYVYIDYRKSTYAPPSVVPEPNNEETIDGQFVTDQTYHNGLVIGINTGSEEVRAIEVIGRSSEDPTAWFLMQEILIFDRAGNRIIDPETTYSFFWYNDSVKSIVTATEVYTLFTFIPIKTKHLELIEGNRLALANMVEGYDRIQPITSMTLSWLDLVSANTVNEQISIQQTVKGYGGGYNYIWILQLDLPTDAKAGLYHIEVYDADLAVLRTADYNWNGTGSYPITVKNGLIAAINAAGWGSEIGVCNTPSDYRICFFQRETYYQNEFPWVNWVFWNSKRTVTAVVAINKFTSLKSGASQSWGIVYRDEAGRISPINGDSEIVKYIPLATESGSIGINQKPLIDFNLNHLPPSWAKSYEIVYSGNKSVSWFLQLVGYDLQWGKKLSDHTTKDYATNYDNRNMRICIDRMYERTRQKMPQWSVEQYVWEKGDRIRLLAYIDSSANITELTTVYDAEIIGEFLDTDYENFYAKTGEKVAKYLYFQRIGNIGTINLPNNGSDFPDMVIEIYRPYKEFSTTLYYTTGMTFDIAVDGNGNKYHKGNTDQTLSGIGEPLTPAIVRNTAHDAWKYLRTYVEKKSDVILSFWCESQLASDYYISQKMTSSGIPIPALDNFRQTLLTKRVRHGGLYNFGTELNNIAKFDYDDYKDVKDEFGPIEGIREVGFILKVIQHTRVSSIYLSRTESYSPDGSQQFLFTNKVFGSLRPGMEQYGTKHPESVIVHNQHLYFWDQSEGAVIRDAANGIFPISKYKMMQFFIDKAKDLEQTGYNEGAVRFAYNVYDDTLYCTFINGAVYETIVFSEQDQRWKFSTDAKINKPFWFGKRMFHYHNGYIYEWWRLAEQGWLVLSGETKTARLRVPATDDPMKLKHYNAMAVYQVGATPIASVKVPAKCSAVGRDQETIASQWVKREGVFYGQILRDINTPGIVGTNNKYMNGIRLRGQYCEITLEVTLTTDKVTIYNIMVMATDSERSM